MIVGSVISVGLDLLVMTQNLITQGISRSAFAVVTWALRK